MMAVRQTANEHPPCLNHNSMTLFPTSWRALRFFYPAGILWLFTLAGFGQAPVFTNAAIVSGFFQTRILITSNAVFTIETSTNLTDWTAVDSMTATNNLITLVDDRGPAAGRQFYRLLLGALVSFNFGFIEFANAGSFGGSFTPATTFPVTISSYSATFGVNNDTNFPAATNVFFTGPGGSGLTNSPANPANSNTNGSKANYQSQFVTSPVIGPGGTWTVGYKGSNHIFNVTAAHGSGHLVVPYPTVTVSGGILQSVSWVFRDATTGSTMVRAPMYLAGIQVLVHGTSEAGELYDSDELTSDITNNILTTSVNWSAVSGISMAYQDLDENNYVISFVGPAVGP